MEEDTLDYKLKRAEKYVYCHKEQLDYWTGYAQAIRDVQKDFDVSAKSEARIPPPIVNSI